MGRLPDYYAILGIPTDANLNLIRSAYKKKALEYHPDRSPNDKNAKVRFQYVNDAYCMLSNSDTREKYDKERKKSTLFNPLSSTPLEPEDPIADADKTFYETFEDILKPEMECGTFWQNLGAASGVILGFIVANVPGAVAGYAGGRYLGKVRDAKGKSVMDVFLSFPQHQRAAILGILLKKVLDNVK
jgi:curved DNA-binding protein CbpA